jgi:cobaltochelatase CobS
MGKTQYNFKPAKDLFNLDIDISAPLLDKEFKDEWANLMPKLDQTYKFDQVTTTAILLGFAYNKRVYIHGYHGAGKSTHIEQVATRLNWPCIRLNLDSYLTKTDLVGKDVIKLEEHKQVMSFQEGLLPLAMRNGFALILDEYDAARPEVLFILQRMLEANGKLVIPEQNLIIDPHPNFRIFATANTIGLGDVTGMYHGTQQINHGQLDRWNLFVNLSYMQYEEELAILLAKFPEYDNDKTIAEGMVHLAGLVRNAFTAGDVSAVISPRTTFNWAENYLLLKDLPLSFQLTFLNRIDPNEQQIVLEMYQRIFG